jgi:RNA polymerase sigma factor FliA
MLKVTDEPADNGRGGRPADRGWGLLDDDGVIEHHLPLVRHVVFQVAVRFPRHVDREELVRAGTLGLVEAARRYDGSRGVPFERFAVQRIRGAILDAVRTADWAPRSLRSSARALDDVSQRLASDLGRMPTTDELAEALSTTREELDLLRARIHRSVVLTLDGDGGGDEGESLGDQLPDDLAPEPGAGLEERELHAYLYDALKLLEERERLVLIGYFLEGRSSADLARFLGVTESRVSQVRTEALAMLRAVIEGQYGQRRSGERVPSSVVRRRAALVAALGSSSDWRARLADDDGEVG